MFDLVKRYSHRSRRKDLRGINHALFDKLQRVILVFPCFFDGKKIPI